MGTAAARFAEAMAVTWAGSQVTKVHCERPHSRRRIPVHVKRRIPVHVKRRIPERASTLTNVVIFILCDVVV
jgi:hypothetical protein